MANQYKRANKFSSRLSIAQAAVEWQQLPPEQQELVLIDDFGIPYLAGTPELTERAEAIAEAAERREIAGVTHNEDGYPFPATRMSLERESVAKWTAKASSRLPPTGPQPSSPKPVPERLVRVEEVCELLGISRSTLYRRIEAGQFESKHLDFPPRWRMTYVEQQMNIDKDDDHA